MLTLLRPRSLSGFRASPCVDFLKVLQKSGDAGFVEATLMGWRWLRKSGTQIRRARIDAIAESCSIICEI